MLRNYYLFDRQGNDRLLSKGHAPKALRDALGPVLVIPRSLCLYLRLDARNVPAWRLRSYVRLQLLAQSPVLQPDVYVARQGEWLHVWLWDREYAASFAKRHRMKASRIEALPSSVLTRRARAGVVWSRCPESNGLQAQLWQAGRMMNDSWFEEQPDALAWRTWREDSLRRHGTTWPEQPEFGHDQQFPARPWARNLLREPATALLQAGAPAARLAIGSAIVATTGFGVWLFAQRHAYETVQQQLQDDKAQMAAKLAPLEQARASALQAQRWMAQVDGLRPRRLTLDVIRRIGTVLTAQGAVLRDLDIQGDVVRATVVPTVGELNLTELTAALTRATDFEDVRFIDPVSPNGFRFSWRLRNDDKPPATVAPKESEKT